MATLYIANKNYSSWSLRPWVLMRELGIPFEERLVRFQEGGSRTAFRAFSPTGQVPCLVDDGITAWESMAIVEHLAERHAGVWPADPAARTWARSAAAEMHAGFAALRDICGMCVGIRVRLHERPPALERDIARIDELWSEGLARFGGPFLAGAAFTAADAFFCPVAFRVQTYGLDLSSPAAAYARRLLDLPAMREWYEAGLKEPWREPGHEADLRAHGEWTQDLRAATEA